MESILSKLEKIIVNFKKAGSRGYQRSTLLIKLEEVELIKREFLDLIDRDIVKPQGVKKDTDRFEIYYNKAKNLLEESLNKLLSDQTQNLTNMADFNLETSIKVIPEFSGNYKELNSFLTTVELVNDTLKIEQRQILLKFVYNVKLTNTVRTSLGISIPATFEELKSKLSDRYKSTKTVAQLQSTLNNFHQKNMNIHTYHEKILQLISELNELQIKEIPNCSTIQSDTIRLVNESYALNIFKNGLKGELKPTIFASRPRELNEAVQLALELEKEFNNNSDQVLYFSQYRYSRERRQNNTNDYRRNSNRNNFFRNNYRGNNTRRNNSNQPRNNNDYNFNRQIDTNRQNGGNNRSTNQSNNYTNNGNRTRYNNDRTHRNVRCIQENCEAPDVN